MASGGGFAFGPFTLDPSSQRLLRDGAPIRLTPPQFRVLHALVGRAGEMIDKDTLVRVGWEGTFMGDNNLVQTVLRLRRVLDANDSHRYIETIPRTGYRFVGSIERVAPRRTEVDLDALISPYGALIDGRAALETLERTHIERARTTFVALLAQDRTEAAFHVGLANACALLFETTRADPVPDEQALREAAAHAQEACRLAPDYAEAWATLGFVLERTGARAKAVGALVRSVKLEPDNWRHHLRLSSASWGEDRLRAARRTLEHLPDAPLAHVLAATVYVARDARAAAERELDAGLSTIESGPPARFPHVALHWLKGLLCLARGADVEAMEAFNRELALEPQGHLYTRECSANTWYAIGARHLQQGDAQAAERAFDEALKRVSGHLMARAGLRISAGLKAGGSINHLSGGSIDHPPDGSISHLTGGVIEVDGGADLEVGPGRDVDRALARAAWLVACGDATAAAIVDAAIASAPAGNAGWLVPIEPLLHVQRDRAAWAPVLARLRTRGA